MQKLPEAEAALRQAGKIAPDNPRVWYNLGLTEMDEANQKGAIEDMRKVIAIDREGCRCALLRRVAEHEPGRDECCDWGV